MNILLLDQMAVHMIKMQKKISQKENDIDIIHRSKLADRFSRKESTPHTETKFTFLMGIVVRKCLSFEYLFTPLKTVKKHKCLNNSIINQHQKFCWYITYHRLCNQSLTIITPPHITAAHQYSPPVNISPRFSGPWSW